MDIEQQDFRFELKNLDDNAGTFTGYGSVFGVQDEGQDIVLKGAFAESIAKRKQQNRPLPMLFSHDHRQPIGTYTDVKEDDYGLYVEGRFTKGVSKAEEVRALMKDKAIDGLSIGFRSVDYEIDTNANVRKLKKVDLFEISVVTFPMLDVARAMDVKSSFRLDPRVLERELKEALKLSTADAVSAVAVVKRYLQREAPGIKTAPAREDAGLRELLDTVRDVNKQFNR